MSITLNLVKKGEELPVAERPKIALNLSKGADFKLDLSWDSEHDLDAHALLLTDGKLASEADILSTYCKQTEESNGSFSIQNKALVHSGDCLDGQDKDIDESISINGSNIPDGINEIPVFVTIHDEGKKGFTFEEVKDAGGVIKDGSGSPLEDFKLSDAFKEFNAVQMGTFLLENGSWSFSPSGAGFNGDFNQILSYFS
jgi:tellurium resistance protein TerD